MADKALALVLAGHGDITDVNAAALLDKNIPEGDVSPFATERVTRQQKGLRTALAWFKGEGLEVERTDDPIGQLQDYQNRDKGAWDVQLVMLFDADNEEDVALVAAAHEAGIPVKGLNQAYDDILPEAKPIVVTENALADTGLTSGQVPSLELTVPELAALKLFAQHLLSYQDVAIKVTDTPASSDATAIADAPFEGGTVVGSPTKKPGTTKFLVTDDDVPQYRPGTGSRKKSNEDIVFLTEDEIAALPRAVYDPDGE